MRWMLRSKIHQAIVTQANPDYVGSLTLDEELIEKAGFWIGEKVLVASITSGARLETYLMRGERGSGIAATNGAAARLIQVGESIIVMGFELTERPVEPRVVLVDRNNRFVRFLEEGGAQMSAFQEIKTGNPAHQGWPYSEAVRAGDFIFVAGIGAEDEQTGQIVGETIEEQTRFVFEKIGRILAHAGATLQDVCRVAVHLSDIRDFQRFSDTYASIFSWEPKPTRITNQAGLWPGLLLEVECTAYRPLGR